MRAVLILLVAATLHAHDGTTPSSTLLRKPAPRKPESQNLFCQDPYRALCEYSGGPQRRQRLNQKTQEQNRQIYRTAMDRLKQQLGPSFIPVKIFQLTDEKPLLNTPKTVLNKNYKDYLRALFADLYARVEPPREMERIREAFLHAIDAQKGFGPGAEWEVSEKNKMKNKVREIQYITSAEALIRLAQYDETRAREGKWDPNLLSDFQAHCGYHGLAANSFYNHTVNAVILCPGLLSRAMDDSAPTDYGDPIQHQGTFLWQIVGHETGHAVGNESFPIYGKLHACQRELFGANPQSSAENESDYWGAWVVAGLIRNAGSKEAAIGPLRGAAEPYCDLDSEKNHTHLLGKDRIQMSLGRNESILLNQNCAPPGPQNPVCTLEGKKIH